MNESIVLLLLSCRLLSQCPSQFQIKFTTQQELDNFAVNYPNCTVLNNINVEISDEINSLAPLSNLNRINGQIWIHNTSIVDLEGLQNLNRISGIRIEENTSLENLDHLENLNYIHSDIYIIHNPILHDISGLSGVEHVSHMNIINNDSIYYIGSAFSKVESYKGFEFNENENLRELPKLYNESLASKLSTKSASGVENNKNLLNLKGLDSLHHTGNLDINNNPRLKSLEGLHSLSMDIWSGGT